MDSDAALLKNVEATMGREAIPHRAVRDPSGNRVLELVQPQDAPFRAFTHVSQGRLDFWADFDLHEFKCSQSDLVEYAKAMDGGLRTAEVFVTNGRLYVTDSKPLDGDFAKAVVAGSLGFPYICSVVSIGLPGLGKLGPQRSSDLAFKTSEAMRARRPE